MVKFFKNRFVLVPALVILFAALAGGLGYSYWQYREVKEQLYQLTTPEGQKEMAERQVNEAIEQVGKLFLLPDDERPQVLVIQDVEKLKAEQSFYEAASNGDKILLYAQKAIIYSPERNLIINVGPVFRDDKDAKQAAVSKPAADVLSVEIRNGSATPGAGTSFAGKFSDATKFKVVKVGNAANDKYAKTLVINVSGKDVGAIEQIAGTKAAKALPAGEAKSSADVVIIIGNE